MNSKSCLFKDSAIHFTEGEFKNMDTTLNSGSGNDSSFVEGQHIFLMQKGDDRYISPDINNSQIDDWYFVTVIGILILMTWMRIMYSKFLTILLESLYNYFLASKNFKERNIVQKRFEFIADILYILNGSLFLILLNRFFEWELPVAGDLELFFFSILALSSFMIYRSAVMRMTGFIFNRISLFSEGLYHYFVYNKIIGIGLIPFIIFIPYTKGLFHETLIITALSMIGLIYIMRLVRLIIFTSKNVVLFFYLILYLCTLEILPILVIFKIILSLM